MRPRGAPGLAGCGTVVPQRPSRAREIIRSVSGGFGLKPPPPAISPAPPGPSKQRGRLSGRFLAILPRAHRIKLVELAREIERIVEADGFGDFSHPLAGI